MAAFVKGDVVVVPFPFSATAGAKRRPAVVLASWEAAGRTDYLLCIITSKVISDPNLVDLEDSDVIGGSLKQKSYVRPTYLFAADESMIVYKLGTLRAEKLTEVIEKIVGVLS